MRALGTGILSLWEDEDHWQEQRGWTISPRNLSRMINSTVRSYLIFLQRCDIRCPGFSLGRHVDPLNDYGTTLHSENELTVLNYPQIYGSREVNTKQVTSATR